jgi:transmembrane 9 superfamily member 2/4
MRVDEQCNVLCRIESLSSAQAKAFRKRVEEDYRVNMCAQSPQHHLIAVGADDNTSQDPR